MNNADEISSIKHKVNRLINDIKNKKYSAYAVAKEANLNESNIGKLKNGKRTIDELQFSTIIKLIKFYEDHH